MEFKAASDCALLVRLGTEVNPQTNRRVLALLHSVQSAGLPGVTSFSPSYGSLMIRFDAALTTHAALEAAVSEIDVCDVRAAPVQSHTLPVCYAEAYAPDLAEVAHRTGLPVPDVIEMHTSGTWTVYFLGFLPGFAYMGDLPEILHTPRRSTPRAAVPAGSVAIAGRNTAVYPFTSPGGWNLIGRCPVRLFDHRAERPSLLAPGDSVRFRAVTKGEFVELAGAAFT